MQKNNDTDILLTIGMDATDALQTSKDLKQEVDKIFEGRKGKQSAALTNVQIQMKQTVKALDTVNKKISEIGDQKIPTTEFSKLQEKLKLVQQEFAKVNTQSLKFGSQEKEFDALGERYAEVTKAIEDQKRKVEEAQEAFDKSPDSGIRQAALTHAQQELTNLQNTAAQLEEQMNDTKFDAFKQNEADAAELTAQIQNLSMKMRDLEEEGKAFITVSAQETDEYKKLNAERDVLNDKLKHSIVQHTEINRREDEKLNKQKQQEESLKQLKKSHSDINGAIKKGFRNILKWGFGIRSVFILVRKIRQFLSEGFKNLQASGLSKLTEQMNELKMSTQTLQNALASAFEPIVTTIIPYLQRLIDNLIQAVDKFAQLTAAAKGQKTYIKAIRQTGDALKKMGESANKALGPLDDLNVIQGTQQFEEVEIPDETLSAVSELEGSVAGLKELFTKPIAGGFSEVIKNSADDTTTIKNNIKSIGKSLGDIGSDPDIQESLSSLISATAEATGSIVGVATSLGLNIGEAITGGIDQALTNDGPAIKEHIAYILDAETEATELVNDVVNASARISEAFGGEAMQSIVANSIGIFTDLWIGIQEICMKIKLTFLEMVSPLLSSWLETAGTVLENDILPVIDEVIQTLRVVIDIIIEIATKIIDELVDKVKLIWIVVGPTIKRIGNLLLDAFGVIMTGLKNTVKLFKDVLKIVLDLIRGDLPQAWEDTKGLFKDWINGLIDIVERFGNFLIGFAEGLANNLIEILNGITNKISQAVQVDIPDWVPIFGGKHFGINIPQVSTVSIPRLSIPRLAQGTVIPPSMSEFLAVLGDNKSETEIVSPVSAMKEALFEALEQFSGSKNQEIVLNLDGREFLRAMVKQDSDYKKQHGGVSAFST